MERALPATRKSVLVGDIELSCVVAGSGPLVVLLHGFPQTSHAWRHQIPALATRFRVAAPDLRGYGRSDRPPRVRDYRVRTLARDVVGLVRALGEESAHVVGHDWGGAIAWSVAQLHPKVVDRLAVINCPHPAVFARELRRPSRQALRSWYILFFQLPRWPERVFLRDSAARIGQLIRDTSTGDRAFSEADLLEYRRAFCLPGAASATMNYYRAAFRDALTGRAHDITLPIEAPTLLIWGDLDVSLGTELTHSVDAYAPTLCIEHVPNATHWVNEEQPDRVNRLLLDFLDDARQGARRV